MGLEFYKDDSVIYFGYYGGGLWLEIIWILGNFEKNIFFFIVNNNEDINCLFMIIGNIYF